MNTPVRKNVGPKCVGPKLNKPTPRWVRCLGPREEEHQFFSPDPTTVRVCGKCREMQARLGIGAVRDEPCRTAEQNQ
jgi:hypothetical protein